jgi:homoserine kinase
VALDFGNSYTFAPSEGNIEITGCPEEYRNRDHLTVRAFEYLFGIAQKKSPGFVLQMDTQIPDSRGLGSSAACILAGLFAANEFLGEAFSSRELFDYGCKLEGHPDNIAPAFAGGLCTGIFDEKEDIYDYIRIPVKMPPHLFALVPDFKIETKNARSVLPSAYTKKEMIVALQRLSWLLSSIFTGEYGKIRLGFNDGLHQPYRSKLIPDWQAITEKLERYDDISWFISGSGPTVMVWSSTQNREAENILKDLTGRLSDQWEIIPCHITENGIRKTYAD